MRLAVALALFFSASFDFGDGLSTRSSKWYDADITSLVESKTPVLSGPSRMPLPSASVVRSRWFRQRLCLRRGVSSFVREQVGFWTQPALVTTTTGVSPARIRGALANPQQLFHPRIKGGY